MTPLTQQLEEEIYYDFRTDIFGNKFKEDIKYGHKRTN